MPRFWLTCIVLNQLHYLIVYNLQEMGIATSNLIVYNLQEMSIATFLANLGGMLGFCMGLSLVGVVEIVYHIIVSPLIQLAQFMYK